MPFTSLTFHYFYQIYGFAQTIYDAHWLYQDDVFLKVVWISVLYRDANTIFRGNTLVSKMMDEVMKLAGLHYLHNTLRPSLDLVFQEHRPCEIDPTKVKDPTVIETNLANLKEYVENVFQAITTSALHCPSLMCQMFHDLKELASTRFPGESTFLYSV